MRGKANQISWLLCVLFLACPAHAKYGGGTGEPNDPYLIYTPEQMNTIGTKPNDWDKHFKLMADIDLSEYKGTEFNIIGYRRDWYANKPFTGSFDGNGHTISNLYCTSGDAAYVGLFGLLDNGVISNLWLIDPNVDGPTAGYVGALVGYSWSGTISRCSVQGGSVTGGENAGGLLGYNDGTIIECYSSSSVSGSCAGGLVGCNVGGIIYSSYATGDVSGDTPVGGLVGQNGAWLHGLGEMISVSGAIDNCYSMCSVTGTAAVGGLVGLNDVGNIATCYSSGAVLGNEQVRGLVGKNNSRVSYCFWDVETSGVLVSGGGTGKTTAEMQTADTFLSWGACVPLWTIDEGRDYPRLAWENIPGQVITGPTYGGGAGTAGDPYLIYMAEELNTIGLSFCDWGKHFRLMADIDLSNFDGKDGRSAFNTIGSDMVYPFKGVLDGNGHIVSHLTLVGGGNLGMFGYLESGADIRDLGIVDVNISGSGDCVGALAGYSRGDVTRCYSSGTVIGDWSVGGLVGASWRCVLIQCTSACVVSGNGRIGGLVGSNDGVITQCYSAGAVGGDWRVGGLVGDNGGAVTNCYSASAVDGNSLVGGLIGRNFLGPVAQCYSTGGVNGSSSVGGLVGSDYGGHDVALCFWDTQTSGQTTSAGGTGKTTAEMRSARTFYAWGGCGDELVWTIDEGNDYPRLWWENQPGEAIKPISLSDYLLGTGTKDDPYLIHMTEELNLIGLGVCDWDKHFKLMADMDLSTYQAFQFHPVGLPPSLPFTGIFDGSGHTILNFSYACPYEHCVGLFGYVDSPSAEIKNLRLVEPNIDAGGAERVGSLVGFMRSGTIVGCQVEGGSVKGGSSVSGLVGFNDGGQISKCYSTSAISGGAAIGGLVGYNAGVVIRCYSSGAVSSTGGHYIGGLVGCNSGTVADSYSTSAASARWGVGGLVGMNSGGVTHCYSAGAVRGSSPFGGLVGHGRGDMIQSFWDVETSGQTASAGGVGKTTAEMQTARTFLEAGWDFAGETANGAEDIWWILEGQDYPRLWWEPAGRGGG